MAGEVISAKLSQLEAFGIKVVTDFAALTARVQSLERAGGQPNIIEKILVNGVQLAVDGNKAVNFSVPTKTGELENDAGFQNGDDVDTKLEGKADSGHTHDDRYYTKAEDNGFLADKTGIVCSAKEPDARSILWLNTNWDGKQEDETQIMMLDIGDANGSAPVTVDINGVVTDLFLKTGVENVVITENGSEKTLADKLTEIITALNGKATPADITNALGSYVKKEAGKGLSANDFTTELMTKLNGIAAGAQVNKIESIKVNGTAQVIGADKSVNITVPTKTSDLTNDKKYQTDTEVATAVQTAISKTGHASYQKVSAVPTVDAAQENILYLVMNSTTKHYDIYAKIKGSSGSYTMEQLDDTTVDLTGYVQKETGKGLSTNDYTTAEKQKLANIADGAQVNKMESVKVNGAAQAIAADKSVNISVPVIYAQADQPAGLKAGDMWFQIIE